MVLIDTHTHLYLNAFDADRDALFQRARAAGVTHFLLPAIDSETHPALQALLGSRADCYGMMGVHPCSIGPGWEREVELAASALRGGGYVGVGEIGLDFYWDTTHRAAQEAAFDWQLSLAVELDLPVSIHSRSATDECIAIVTRHQGLRGVFHCFGGTEAQGRAILAAGLYLGIGGVATYKKSGLDTVLQALGPEGVVLETDAPYLAPVPWRGKRNEPAYLEAVAQKLAEIWGMTAEEVGILTTAAAKKVFRLK